ncbi:MAG: outer membrane protein assembly factor BamA [Elusimicrobiaceae bacterium]|jgi:outer membrane protein insertion porin family|nr:outer membrane protein assembly factor BamA [Elusimicrobiaceae bacterium]MBT3955512.1 outer membrane protein assembly factor BamA [Elusimicrobiaceae bacterium]MBT4008532.1 outer membrane protein assembly factor BamA [Elusimicrobiaceae bacterium]MBT4402395.1 outer membrane protein assembly factor BamA [Elusimicrobiaceae bacterium]MBT4440351.1 outer membrane protein assembly factor BamA [Elusimicrobiaceae bacterium]
MKRLLFLILLLPFAIINISAQENLDLETKPRLGHIEIPVKTKQDLNLEKTKAKEEVAKEQGSELKKEAKENLAKEKDEIDPHGPWMVCNIEAEGLVNIRQATVEKNIKAKKGHLYQKTYIYEDMQSLIALDNFSDVKVDIKKYPGLRKDKNNKEDKTPLPCHQITLIVQEKPIVEKILFVGRKKLGKTTLKKEMSLKVKDPYNATKLKGDMIAIERKYEDKGYISNKATFKTEFNEKESIATITITIDEGPRSRVKTLQVNGLENLKHKEKKIIKLMKNRPKKVFKPQELEAEAMRVDAYGRDNGYHEYHVVDRKVDFNEDKSEVYITYDINEGKKSIFGKTVFNGNIVLEDEELDMLVEFKEDKLFNQKKLDRSVKYIQEEYANLGYLKAVIEPKFNFNEDTDKLDVDFDIIENYIVYVDNIDVTGYEKTEKNVFAREVTLKPGDRFSYDKIKKTQTKMMNLGFINDVQIDVTPTAEDDKVDLGFNVVEGTAGMFSAGIAMGTIEGIYGQASVSHMNFLGKAQRLNFNSSFGKNILDYSIAWSTPWIYDHPTSFGVDVFNTKLNRPYSTTAGAFVEKRQGGRLNLGPRFEDDKFLTGFSYGYQTVDISDVDPLYTGSVEEGAKTYSTFGADFAIDTRDVAWDPSSGAKNGISVELNSPFLGGDVDIYQVDLNSGYHHTIFNAGDYPIVFALANRLGQVKSYGRTNEVPAVNRYYLGGADTIRGYDVTGEVGPEEGGNLFYILNAEIRVPLVREGRRNMVQGAFFYDLGNSWKNRDEIKYKIGKETDEFKSGFGVGIRFTTPMFPIRIDYGYGLNHKAGQDKAHFYFTVGNFL